MKKCAYISIFLTIVCLIQCYAAFAFLDVTKRASFDYLNDLINEIRSEVQDVT